MIAQPLSSRRLFDTQFLHEVIHSLIESAAPNVLIANYSHGIDNVDRREPGDVPFLTDRALGTIPPAPPPDLALLDQPRECFTLGVGVHAEDDECPVL